LGRESPARSFGGVRRGLPDGATALLLRVARGDETAFEAFYDCVASTMYGVVLSVVRDPAQAQEVTQEVFLEIWRTSTRFDPTLGSATAWATTMARRRAVDRVRSAQATLTRDAEIGARDTVRDYDVVSETVEVRLEQQQVRRCLDGLTERQRQAVILAFYRGYTHREVSDLLAVPLGTAKARLRDGLIRMRDCLGCGDE
jgi:RNA polymerase sigma-70 factor (ECF subfamily)